MKPQEFPPRWNEERVQRLIAEYDAIDEDALVAEDEAQETDGSESQ
jgi:hypothetical protein